MKSIFFSRSMAMLLVSLITISYSSVIFLQAQNQENYITDQTDRSEVELIEIPFKALKEQLLTSALTKSSTIIELPTPTGEWMAFHAIVSSIMEAPLEAAFPELRSFQIVGLENTAWKGRVAISPLGLSAVILTPEGSMYIERTQLTTFDPLHKVYFSKNLSHADFHFECKGLDGHFKPIDNTLEKSVACNSLGTQLRTFRIAIGSSEEFTNGIGGGSIAVVNALINERLNGLNVIYENELSIHFDLAANNQNAIIFNNSSVGLFPYAITTAHSVLNLTVGSSNYDIGHFFTELESSSPTSIVGAGIAGVGVTCNSSSKGQGWTGTSANAFLDFVLGVFAHEVGHQLSALHTFYGTKGTCGDPGQRNAGNGYEPGSGNSLMAYQGVCDTSQNILPIRFTNYFHIHSILQINSFVNSASCKSTSGTGNTPPSVSAPNNFTIPKQTPFELNGSASDAQDNNLTYNWEQYDTNNSMLPPGSDSGNPENAATSTTAPLFRSFDPSSDSKRVFPKITDIIDNTQTKGEILPQVGRTIKMRLTVRDNHADGLGQGNTGGGMRCDEVSITVSNAGGPFRVTSPNTDVDWEKGVSRPVSWSVAGSNNYCGNVRIRLSIDGGFTYPYTLLASTPNDGSANVIVPTSVPNTVNARIRVECATNPNATFFDISNEDFTIEGIGNPNSAPIELSLKAYPEPLYKVGSNPPLSDDGRINNSISLTEPFTAAGYHHVNGGGGETINASVLGDVFPVTNRIVGWVFIELRPDDDDTEVFATRSALLQRDGDVVDTDGTSPVSFEVEEDDYYVVLRFLGGLPIMTDDTVFID